MDIFEAEMVRRFIVAVEKIANALGHKTEPTISKMEQVEDEPTHNKHVQHVGSVETMSCQECKRWIYDDRWGWFCPLKGQDECNYEPKTEPQPQPTTDCRKTDRTGSPIGDYRDGAGAWQTEREGVMKEVIMKVPSFSADYSKAPIYVADLVRCKECKYAHMTYGGDCKYCDMWKDDDDFCIELYLDGDFYCGYGERKGE